MTRKAWQGDWLPDSMGWMRLAAKNPLSLLPHTPYLTGQTATPRLAGKDTYQVYNYKARLEQLNIPVTNWLN